MRTVLFSTVMVTAVVWIGIGNANAAPPSVSGMGKTNIQATTVENVGYRRRFYFGDMGIRCPMRTTLQRMATMGPRPHTPIRPQLAIIRPPDGNYADAPPPDGYYADAPPPDGNYADAPPPESY